MTQSLKKMTQDYIEQVALTSEQLKILDALQQNMSQHATIKPSRQWWYALTSIAAMVLLTLVFLLPDSLQTSDSLVAELAAEAVDNHLYRKPLEVNTNQIDGILDYFTGLDFSPVTSHYLASQRVDLSLIGGRYCSLQGVTAAQLRFKSVGKNDINTLYQVGYDPKIFKYLPDYDQGQEPITTYSKGIKVTLWIEKGVLFALTEDP